MAGAEVVLNNSVVANENALPSRPIEKVTAELVGLNAAAVNVPREAQSFRTITAYDQGQFGLVRAVVPGTGNLNGPTEITNGAVITIYANAASGPSISNPTGQFTPLTGDGTKTNLGGVCVGFGIDASPSKPESLGGLYYVSPSQINAVVPDVPASQRVRVPGSNAEYVPVKVFPVCDPSAVNATYDAPAFLAPYIDSQSGRRPHSTRTNDSTVADMFPQTDPKLGAIPLNSNVIQALAVDDKGIAISPTNPAKLDSIVSIFITGDRKEILNAKQTPGFTNGGLSVMAPSVGRDYPGLISDVSSIVEASPGVFKLSFKVSSNQIEAFGLLQSDPRPEFRGSTGLQISVLKASGKNMSTDIFWLPAK